MLLSRSVSTSDDVEFMLAYLARSVGTVSGPRILYNTFAPCILPTFDKRYWVGAEYVIRMLGLNNQICDWHEVLVDSGRAATYQNPWSLLFVIMKNKSIRCVGLNILHHIFNNERRQRYPQRSVDYTSH